MLENTAEIPLELLQRLIKQAKKHNMRRLLVLAGSKQWTQTQWHSLEEQLPLKNVLFIRCRQTACSYLGKEFSHVVYDAFSGFSADLFCLVAGLVQGGGLLILLTPQLDDWPRYPDPDYHRLLSAHTEMPQNKYFLCWLARKIRADKTVLLLQQHQEARLLAICQATTTVAGDPLAQDKEQQLARAAFRKVAVGHRNRPLVITAARGRGKSSFLGVFAGELLLEHPKQHIVVTASRRSCCQQLFQHACAQLPSATVTQDCIEYQQACLKYIAPDILLHTSCKVQLLLIDEAASLPTHLLIALLQRYKRVVLTTTTDGYEGSGQGFLLKFMPFLNKHHPGWKQIELTCPYRWAKHDPLETFINRLFFLDATQAVLPTVHSIAVLKVRAVSREELLQDEILFNRLGHLLVQAHYQTTANHVRALLDDSRLHILVAFYQQFPVAILEYIEEGGFADSLAAEVLANKRRLQGHLAAQVITKNTLVTACTMNSWRIHRIAVHPLLQRQGIGRLLVKTCKAAAQAANIAFVSTCFSASPTIMLFWFSQHFQFLCMGLKKETSSGEYSATLAYALSAAGQQLVRESAHNGYRQWFYHLNAALCDLPAEIIKLIMVQQQSQPLACDDLALLKHFAHTEATLENCLPALSNLLFCQGKTYAACCSDALFNHLIALAVKKQSWSQVLSHRHSKKALLQQLRNSVQQLLLENV